MWVEQGRLGCGVGVGRAAWALVPAHCPGTGDGGSCRVEWDMRINIHLPMHMDNAHSCPACSVFIRTNCFRSNSGSREVACPFTGLGQGGCLQLCVGGGAPSCLDQHPSHGMKPASSHFLFAQLDALLVLAGLGVERGHE